jgi:hypothetical protein
MTSYGANCKNCFSPPLVDSVISIPLSLLGALPDGTFTKYPERGSIMADSVDCLPLAGTKACFIGNVRWIGVN